VCHFDASISNRVMSRARGERAIAENGGRIIGGTALVDASVRVQVYPNMVRPHGVCVCVCVCVCVAYVVLLLHPTPQPYNHIAALWQVLAATDMRYIVWDVSHPSSALTHSSPYYTFTHSTTVGSWVRGNFRSTNCWS
jgi:hypothetical protein